VIYHFRVLDSTNTYALKLLSQIRPKAGTLISADYQTTGRGQMGRDWHSAPGLNLCLSCILYPETNAQNQFAISMAVALAVRDTVADFINQERVKIKWPNDIYVGDKKIAGILIQTSIHGNVIIYCVAGIGLNVNETDFPAELPNPTSLKLETTETLDRDLPDGSQELSIPEGRLSLAGRQEGIVNSWDINAVQERLTENLSKRLNLLGSPGTRLHDDYHSALYRRDIQSHFRIFQNKSIQSGTIEKVDELGRLIIRWKNGEIRSYQHHEIEYV